MTDTYIFGTISLQCGSYIGLTMWTYRGTYNVRVLTDGTDRVALRGLKMELKGFRT